MANKRFFRLAIEKLYPGRKAPEVMKIPVPGYPPLEFRNGVFSTENHSLAEGLSSAPSHANAGGNHQYNNDSGQLVTLAQAPPIPILECSEEEFEAAMGGELIGQSASPEINDDESSDDASSEEADEGDEASSEEESLNDSKEELTDATNDSRKGQDS